MLLSLGSPVGTSALGSGVRIVEERVRTPGGNATTTTQRIIAVIVLVGAGFLSLPLAAWMLDGRSSTENLILPFQLLVMALIGAGLAWWLPALARSGAPMGARLLMGAGWGLLAAVIGLFGFWFLLSGFGGA